MHILRLSYLAVSTSKLQLLAPVALNSCPLTVRAQRARPGRAIATVPWDCAGSLSPYAVPLMIVTIYTNHKA